MREKIIIGLVFAAGFFGALIVLWAAFPDLTESQHFAGISGALGGMIGGILGVTYVRRLHDERFVQLENRAAKNAFSLLILGLPISVAFIGLMQSIELAMGIVLGIWAISLGIFYLSLLYYYRK
jgi:drug/metabolite transporter (DMT)-like permease